MADENKSKPLRQAPPSMPPPIITETHVRAGRPWLALIIYLLIALAVAAIIVFGGRWLYHQFRDEPTKKVTTSDSNKAPEPPAVSDNNKSTDSSSNSNNNPSPASNKISDTGPGNVIALFVTVTIAVAGLHYIASLRKTS